MYKYLFLVLIVPSCSPTPKPVPKSSTSEIITAYNKFRISNGKKPLLFNPLIQKACEEHAMDMAKGKFLSHIGSNGSTPFTRLTKIGYEWSKAGENIAQDQDNVENVMSIWEKSPGHLSNILDSDYTEIGATCVNSYWCVDFGTPLKLGSYRAESSTSIEKTEKASSIRMK